MMQKTRTFLIAAACLLTMACGSPDSLKEVSPDIREVRESGEVLTVKAQQSMVSEGLAMTQLGALVGQIAEGIQADVPGSGKGAKWLRLQLSYTTVDRLGQEGSVDAGTLTFPMADLRAANSKNLMGTMWLALVNDIGISAGSDPMVKHCANPANFADDREFCSKVAAAVK